MNEVVDERLMTIADLSTMLGGPIDTLYGWRHRGEGPRGLPRRPPRSLSPLQRQGLAGGVGRPTLVAAVVVVWPISSGLAFVRGKHPAGEQDPAEGTHDR
jgi:hypothetical protein